MRALTALEMNLVAGGNGSDTGTFTVTHSAPGGTNWSPLLPSGDGGGGDGGTGGGRTSSRTGPAKAGVVHLTPEGHTYKSGINLTQEQTTNLDKIVDYGFDHGYDPGAIRTIATAAFMESSLNTNPSGTNRTGIGQYNQSTWDYFGETGSINNVDDQVKALYHDYTFFQTTWSNATATNDHNINDSGLNFAEYYEYKHHYGRSATDWNQLDPISHETTKQTFDKKYNELNLS